MIDLSQLPAPRIVETLDYETIRRRMLEKLEQLLPGWTAADLEADPAVKILEVAAWRELLLRQRVNEAAKAVMLAFAAGSDLDQLAAFPGVKRLPGAAATFPCSVTLTAALSSPVTVPAGWAVRDASGGCEARLMKSLSIRAGETEGSGVMEVVRPLGAAANGLNAGQWLAVQPLPFVGRVEQTEAASGGSDEESDAALRARAQLAPESWSTAGPAESYRWWALSADGRIADAAVSSPAPGDVRIVVLSAEAGGTADEAMLERVRQAVNDEKRRPLTDHVSVVGASIVGYDVNAHLEIPAGVSAAPVIAEATRRLEACAAETRRIGSVAARSALIAAAHAPGVRRVTLVSPPSDVVASNLEAPLARGVSVTYEAVE